MPASDTTNWVKNRAAMAGAMWVIACMVAPTSPIAPGCRSVPAPAASLAGRTAPGVAWSAMAAPQVLQSAPGGSCRSSYRILSKCQYPERPLIPVRLGPCRARPAPAYWRSFALLTSECSHERQVLPEAADEVRNQPVPVGGRHGRRPHAGPRAAEADRLRRRRGTHLRPRSGEVGALGAAPG